MLSRKRNVEQFVRRRTVIKGTKMGHQKLLQQVLCTTLAILLVGCSSSSIAPTPLSATQIPSSDTHVLPTQTPLPLSMSIQEGNNLTRTLLHAIPSSELSYNRIGGLCHPPWCVRDENRVNDEFFDLGLKGVLRITLNEIESYSIEDWSASEFHISSQDDEWITYVGRNITLAYTLSFWDKANHPSGWEGISSRFKTEEEIQHYLEYVRFIVNHFLGRIHYYEIWNEPDIGYPFQYIEAADYINLVKRTTPVIREIDPEAKIIVGSVSGFNNPASQVYLYEILQSDVMSMVDVVSWHPFFGASPQFDDVSEYYYEYPSLVQKIKDLASAHGFVGEYSADELTWRTPLNADEGQPWTYSEITAAKYYARAIVSHLGMDVSAGIMVDPRLMVIRSTIGNLCTLMDGAHPESLPVEVQSQAENIRNYNFSLPDGNRLIIVWSDNVAADEYPGTASIITIQGFSKWNVIGIDPLHGFEQELITSDENGNLIISDVLIKDYPIVIKLSE